MNKKHEKPKGAAKDACKYCERTEDTRLGGCFDCADMESMFFDRTDMYDNDYSDWSKGELLAYIIRKSMSYVKSE